VISKTMFKSCNILVKARGIHFIRCTLSRTRRFGCQVTTCSANFVIGSDRVHNTEPNMKV
jgi:hypothetical protein